jgi:hypothetical protein
MGKKIQYANVAMDGDNNAMPNDDFMWYDQRMDYTTGDLDYRGVSKIHKADVGDDVWWIWKYTWSGSNCERIEGPLIGNWTGRAALDWA